MNVVELLSPAKNAEIGIQAINHGADAVYIGGPSLGARKAAGNSIADIERLVAHAHRFNARVFLTLNTLLNDNEFERARSMIWSAYRAGVDAIIIQDMGLLEMDLPPIALHASTQCDIRTPEKARFLESVGFSQMVLARELSLPEITKIRAATDQAVLEFFIHGSLCVSYSGQCYLSYAKTGRSANRGDCAQLCRLPYQLSNERGIVLHQHKHFLSLKDNNQTANLGALLAAGVRSFKIEGRLKDVAYVKNITAHYRQEIDRLLNTPEFSGLQKSASGTCQFSFTPAPEKTFNRGATDYFVQGRQADIAALDTPKFLGEPAGQVIAVFSQAIDVETALQWHNGDGLSYFTPEGELDGVRVSRVEPIQSGFRLFLGQQGHDVPPSLQVATAVYRNLDQAFERTLEGASAVRRVPVQLFFEAVDGGFLLTIRDDRGVSGSAFLKSDHVIANAPARAYATLETQLSKLGNTPYIASKFTVLSDTAWFLPISSMNTLRRDAVVALEAARLAQYQRPQRLAPQCPVAPYPEQSLDYLGNVMNEKARAFYARHGVEVIQSAYETHAELGDVSLMITRHCIRYSVGQCPKLVKGIRPEPWVLQQGKQTLSLRFDCKACEMHVVGRLSAKIAHTPGA